MLRLSTDGIPAAAASSPTIYFLKHAARPIEAEEDEAEMDRIMARCVEHGSLRGNSLQVLDHLVNTVFLPLLQNHRDQVEVPEMSSSESSSEGEAAAGPNKSSRTPATSSAGGKSYNDDSEASPGLSSEVGEDFVAMLTKFGLHIRRTIHHIEGQSCGLSAQNARASLSHMIDLLLS